MDNLHVLLSGIVGSTAYGLAGAHSDLDRLGVFAAPTEAFHGLHRPRQSIVTTAPDETLHEAAKYASLCLSGNPTAMELLWLPNDLYEVRTPLGDELVGLRQAFLSADRVRDAYLGYAGQQFRKLESRGDGTFSADTRRRTAKHARHLARLVQQGRELFTTGRLRIRLDDPQWFLDFGEEVAAGGLDRARKLLAEAEHEFGTARTVLPARPNEAVVEKWLLDVRKAYLTSGHAAAPADPRKVFLVDIDGTVALRDEDSPKCRGPFDWRRVGEDIPNEPVIAVVRAIAAAGHPIIYMSGRSEECRAATSVWIAEHVRVPGVALLMRPRGDSRPDDVVKRLLYRRMIKPNYEVVAVLDDRDRVVRMWRDLGLTVLQVAEGDF